jgi:hypothetical protein
MAALALLVAMLALAVLVGEKLPPSPQLPRSDPSPQLPRSDVLSSNMTSPPSSQLPRSAPPSTQLLRNDVLRSDVHRCHHLLAADVLPPNIKTAEYQPSKDDSLPLLGLLILQKRAGDV